MTNDTNVVIFVIFLDASKLIACDDIITVYITTADATGVGSNKKKEAPDMETESIKGDILKLDTGIRSLMDRMAEADDVVFAYIQQRIKELHSKKAELERKLQTKIRKRRAIDTKPLQEPLSKWDELTAQEKHDVAAEMIEVV